MKLVSGLGRAPRRAPGQAAGSDRGSLAPLETSGMHASLCQPGECEHASGPAATDSHAAQKTNRVGADSADPRHLASRKHSTPTVAATAVTGQPTTPGRALVPEHRIQLGVTKWTLVRTI